MITLRVRRITYEEREIEPEDLMTLREAADWLGISLQAVINLVNRGRLTELQNPEPLHAFKQARFVLRAEVEAMAEQRQRAQTLGRESDDE